MADANTISGLATAGGTLVLAVATFSAVRSSNKSAQTAERALLAGIRPVLVPSRVDDPMIKINWGDEHWTRVEGSRAAVEVEGDVIYLAMSLRNVGSGIAVLQAWWPAPEALRQEPHADIDSMRRQQRDIYVPAGDIGFWQGAIREPDDPCRPGLLKAFTERTPITVELLYSDHEGGQRTITRFAFLPFGEGQYMCTVGRHWNIDRPDPR